MIIIYPYKMNSRSAVSLQQAIQSQGIRCKRVRADGRYRPKRTDLIINWGNSRTPAWATWMWEGLYNQVLNIPQPRVAAACNKLTTFQILQQEEVSIPEFTTDRMYAVNNWMSNNIPFLVRTKLSGHSGEGIYYIQEGMDALEDLEGPLYVRYIKKANEYRVHVLNGEVIDVQEKRKRKDYEGEINTKIRNHNNGWVFCRDAVTPDAAVLSSAVAAVAAVGLDFGAVDVIWNERFQKEYVLEVNTAPGLEGTTLQRYAQKFIQLHN